MPSESIASRIVPTISSTDIKAWSRTLQVSSISRDWFCVTGLAKAVNETGKFELRFQLGALGMVRLRKSWRCRMAGQGRPNSPPLLSDAG